MKFYYTYNQLTAPTGTLDKKKLFKSNFLAAFKTAYPAFGIFSIFVIVLIGNYFYTSAAWLEKGLLAGLGGVIYFHFHCMGIQKLINQKLS